MSNILILNQPQVNVGLVTVTYTVPVTGVYNMQAKVTVPEALATGDGAGSSQGLGAGTGGGGEGFTGGDLGLGHGGVGQGFGTGNGYQQPPAAGSNATTGPAISSGLSIVFNVDGSPVFTAPVLSTTQSAQQFKISSVLNAAQVLTVVLSSSTASDQILNGIKSIITVAQGFAN